jgi:hypothetical protein
MPPPHKPGASAYAAGNGATRTHAGDYAGVTGRRSFHGSKSLWSADGSAYATMNEWRYACPAFAYLQMLNATTLMSPSLAIFTACQTLYSEIQLSLSIPHQARGCSNNP